MTKLREQMEQLALFLLPVLAGLGRALGLGCRALEA